MHVVTLSDHASEQASQAGAQREAEFQEARGRYNAALTARTQQAANLAALRRQAWDERRYVLWMVRWLPCIMHGMKPQPAHPVPRAASRDEIVWNTGREGEQKVLDRLARLLDQRWTLICGFRNAKGEVDQLLVGPAGIVAIEIKYVNGRVSCDGERWTRDKFDRYGNLVERDVPIADKRGRGPSAQVNDVADMLERQLKKRGLHVPRIVRAVILSHDRADIGYLRNATVDIVSTLSEWNIGALNGTAVLAADRVQGLVDAICREHASFSPRAGRPGPARARADRVR